MAIRRMSFSSGSLLEPILESQPGHFPEISLIGRAKGGRSRKPKVFPEERFEQLPKARRYKIAAWTDKLIAEETTLAKLREARLRSQAQIADMRPG
jgi:hypothetical protein